jgi:hypothetical protein
MRTLQRALRAAFQPPRATDPQRRAREEAKRLAGLHGICLEKLGGGINVWPPRGYVAADPYEGDHYAQDWCEALDHIRAYVPEEASRTA